MSKSKVIYCTYFNKNYLLKGLALHASLVKFDPSAKLWILCMDNCTKELLDRMALKGVTTIALADFEDEELKIAKTNRSLVEYFWTCTPSVPRYVLRKNREIDMAFYLDADLFFYSSPEPIFKEFGTSSIYMVEHRYPEGEMYRCDISGRFNVAVNIFRNDKEGNACVNYWRAKCNEWCYLKEEPGRFGDQLYLNEWPTKYKKVTISLNLGVDAAPWNISKYSVSEKKGETYINQDKLIIYHFHQLEYYTPQNYIFAEGYSFSTPIKDYIYKPYIQALNTAFAMAKKFDPNYKLIPQIKSPYVKLKRVVSKYFGPTYWYLRGIFQ